METFLDKLKNILKLCMKYKKYIGAVALLIILVVVLAKCTSPQGAGAGKTKDSTEAAEATKTQNGTEVSGSVVNDFEFDSEFENDSDDAVKTLLDSYYTAYAAGDVDTLSKIAKPISDNEKSYIGVLSKYYDKIMNITYFSKNGATEGAYFVSIRYDIKFKDVDSTAPALDFFYVETGDDNNLYINNLYSIYNLTFAENAMDPDIYSLIQQYMQQDDFVKLQNEVQVAYNEALTGDEKLSKMLKETLDKAIREWAATIRPVKNDDTNEPETEETKETETEEPKEEETQKPEDSQASEENNKPEDQNKPETAKVVTTDNVNIRSKADAESEALGKAEAGQTFEKLGTEGEWTIVKYGDKKGYIKSEFLKDAKDKSNDASENKTENKTEKKETKSNVITIDGVNVRAKASTDAEVLGKVEAGETLEKLGTEGEWTIVKYGDKKGYIKSEFLKAASSKKSGKKVIAIDGVNVRAKASTDAEVLGRVLMGDTLEKVGTEGEWTIVKYGDKKGYIKSEFLEEVR